MNEPPPPPHTPTHVRASHTHTQTRPHTHTHPSLQPTTHTQALLARPALLMLGPPPAKYLPPRFLPYAADGPLTFNKYEAQLLAMAMAEQEEESEVRE